MGHRMMWAAGAAALALLAGCGDGAADKGADAADDAAAPAAPAASNAPAGADKAGAAAPAPAAANAADTSNLPAEEQARIRQGLGALLNAAGAEIAREGYAPAAGQTDQVVTLAQGSSRDVTLNLRGGQSYRIVGVCDGDCNDVDMELRNAAGAVVGSDVLTDDVPIVDFRPPADGAYSARLIMKNCTVAPCFAAARVFQRN